MQIYGRVWFRLFVPNPDLAIHPELRLVTDKWSASIPKPNCLLQPWRFRFLNEEHQCRFPEDWNNSTREKLWLYNLHYFDELQNTGAEPRLEWHILLIEKWVRDNAPGQGNGWEPYPLSLRIVNWIKWVLNGNQLSPEALQSLAVQVRYLFKRIEYHFLGNHLFTNAKALLFAGLFFQGSEAEKWLERSFNIFAQELPEQVLKDGGHFERSPMYHAIILEDLLDIVNIMRTYQFSVPGMWEEKVANMLYWLSTMCHPDGEIALFNDAAFSIASSPNAIYEYAHRLGFSKEVRDIPGVTCLDPSGYIRCRQKNMLALLDVGAIGPDYLTAHSHADTLSFELSLYGQRVIVDTGTSCYGSSEERVRQRSTSAHNTITIDDLNSSEVWGGFRVARRAKPGNLEVVETEGEVVVSCTQDGYQRLPGKVIHKRVWIFEEGRATIKDTLSGKFNKALSRFHFHPDVHVTQPSSDTGGEAVLSGGEKVKWMVKGGIAQVVKTTYHPEFGVILENWCLEITLVEQKCEVLFVWG